MRPCPSMYSGRNMTPFSIRHARHSPSFLARELETIAARTGSVDVNGSMLDTEDSALQNVIQISWLSLLLRSACSHFSGSVLEAKGYTLAQLQKHFIAGARRGSFRTLRDGLQSDRRLL